MCAMLFVSITLFRVTNTKCLNRSPALIFGGFVFISQFKQETRVQASESNRTEQSHKRYQSCQLNPVRYPKECRFVCFVYIVVCF
jgi:hypothetical protein